MQTQDVNYQEGVLFQLCLFNFYFIRIFPEFSAMKRVGILGYRSYYLALYSHGQLTCCRPPPPWTFHLKFVRHTRQVSPRKSKNYFIVINKIVFQFALFTRCLIMLDKLPNLSETQFFPFG